MSNGHRWHFFRAGGFDQVRLDSGADLARLNELDLKLWVALACPTRGIEFDTKTLDLIDTDHDGRIRAPEIIAAAKWAAASLKSPDDLTKPAVALPLSAINDATTEGKQLLASAREILLGLGKKDAAEITVEDTTDTTRIFSQTKFNGDGIVAADAAEDADLKAVINDIIVCLGAEPDRSGKPGIGQAKVDQFFVDSLAYSDWWKKGESDPNVLPLGEATPTAAATLRAVKTKVDDFFARCRLAAYDARALGALNRQETEYLTVASKDLSLAATEVSGFPVARIEAGRPLPLVGPVNPAWAGALQALQQQVVKPLLRDKPEITENDWATMLSRFAPYEAWAAGKAGVSVETLGIKRIREVLAGTSKEAIGALIARDKALEPEFNSIAAVDRLTRYYRDLYKLLNNFVSFRDFYGRKDKAVFQAGTLYLDQRSCELCVRVDDMGRHAALATLSQMYLAYCECVRKATGEKTAVVAVFTGGDSDSLSVGRNGIFYDRQGRDWDATIVKIVDNPISIRQSFWAPYKKFIRVIEDQVAKRAAAADATAAARMQTTATGVAPVDTRPPEPPKKIDTGTLAAIGLVLTTLLAALGGIFAAFSKLPLWQIPLAILGIMLAISIPSMIIAWLKLRQRNLGPILDANGWAINAKAKINIPFGDSLTGVATLPPGAQRDLADPFAESHAGRNRLMALLIVLIALWGCWFFGLYEKFVPGVLPKSPWLRHLEAAQAAQQAQPPAPHPAPRQ